MFDLNGFITTNIVNGVKNGTFTKEYANIMTVNYMLKGVLTQDDIVSVSTNIEAWEAEQNAVVKSADPSEEIMVEDLIAELGTETETTDETEFAEKSEQLLEEDGEPLI